MGYNLLTILFICDRVELSIFAYPFIKGRCMYCSKAFILALKTRRIKKLYSKVTLWNYKYLHKRGKLPINVIHKLMLAAGYEMIHESQWRTRKKPASGPKGDVKGLE